MTRITAVRFAAILAVATGALGAATVAGPSPARAESTYWQDRWEGRGYYDPQAYPRHRSRGARVEAHPDVTIARRRAPTREEDYARRSYNGPVYQSQEEVQQSVYDFATGGFGNIKSYR